MSGDDGEKAKAAAAGGGGGGGGGGEYGTFQGPPSYPPPRPPVVGYPQPAPPPGLFGQPQGDAYYRPRGGYQAVPVQDYGAGRGHSHDRLPCCGIGIGWFLFIFGFFLGAIPWYVGAFLLWCSRVDYREKPGYVACTIAAVLATIAIIIGATAGAA
ncbi:60S ribosomal protein L18a-like protein [Oryza brachyantha]|nr:60S ribosomal protein L18a-like protein [Oryza brachyantha]